MAEKTYVLKLNADDYEKAINDAAFAQSLLSHAKVDCELSEAVKESTIGEAAEDQAYETDTEAVKFYAGGASGLENDPNDRHVWSFDESMCLIKSIEIHMDDLSNPRKKKGIFETVSNDMLNSGYSVTPLMCRNKWKNLIRSHKSVKDNQTKTGRGPTRFVFFEIMENLLNNGGNSDELRFGSFDRSEDEQYADSCTTVPNCSWPSTMKNERKRKVLSCDKNDFLQLRREEHRKREERHKQKVKLAERQLALEEKKITLLQNYLRQKKMFHVH